MPDLISEVRWIDADYDVPHNHRTVLLVIVVKNTKRVCTWIGYYERGNRREGWCYRCDGEPVEDTVTHWAEFPEPPELSMNMNPNKG